MKFIYICSPYRAADAETLKRKFEYAKELTREVLMRGDAPVTVHLYMTQCLREEREIGLAAGRRNRQNRNRRRSRHPNPERLENLCRRLRQAAGFTVTPSRAIISGNRSME